MRTVDIITSQKVTIRYELAPLRDRIVAWIIDFSIIVAAWILMAVIFASSTRGGNYWPLYLAGLIPVFYNLFFEVRMKGQTPGKRALGIRVVKLDGRRMAMTDHIILWAFRLVDIMLSLGSVAAIMISSGNRSQRLGNILSNTVVIKLMPSHSVYLQDLLKIQTNEGYKPQYMGVTAFNEGEMLLIKEVLDRHRNHPNAVHDEAMTTLAEKVAQELRLGSLPGDASEFLKAVLKDYVVMTR